MNRLMFASMLLCAAGATSSPLFATPVTYEGKFYQVANGSGTCQGLVPTDTVDATVFQASEPTAPNPAVVVSFATSAAADFLNGQTLTLVTSSGRFAGGGGDGPVMSIDGGDFGPDVATFAMAVYDRPGSFNCESTGIFYGFPKAR